MRHLVVTRSSTAVFGLLVATCLAFAWSVRGQQATEEAPPAADERPRLDAGRLFVAHCGRCHERGEIPEWLPEAVAAAEEAAILLSLLEDHGEADEAQDREIVEFLWGEALRSRIDPAQERDR